MGVVLRTGCSSCGTYILVRPGEADSKGRFYCDDCLAKQPTLVGFILRSCRYFWIFVSIICILLVLMSIYRG